MANTFPRPGVATRNRYCHFNNARSHRVYAVRAELLVTDVTRSREQRETSPLEKLNETLKLKNSEIERESSCEQGWVKTIFENKIF